MAPPELSSLPKALEARLNALEARVALLEKATPPNLLTRPLPGAEPQRKPATTLPVLGGIGRVLLILGGAFFLRALTEAGTLPHSLGVGFGVAYAMLWTLQAWRSPRPADAGFHTLASVLIAYPLLVEATNAFAVVSPLTAAVLLLTLTALHLAVAWRHDLVAVAWMTVLANLGTGLTLLVTTHAIEPLAGIYLLMGAGMLWLPSRIHWQGLRWLTALAADLVILLLGILAAWPGGAPEAYGGLHTHHALLLSVTLPLLYVGSFIWRMLQKQTGIRTFEWVQSALALGIGLGGAIRISLAANMGTGALEGLVLVTAVGSYVAAFRFAPAHEEAHDPFAFFTSLGMVLWLTGAAVLLTLPAYGIFSAALGLSTMALGLRSRHPILVQQGALCLGLASVVSGLVLAAWHGFLGPAQSLDLITRSVWVVASAFGLVGLLVEFQRPAEGFPTHLRVTLVLLGTLGVLCMGGLAVTLLAHLGGAALTRPAALAFLRTATLSAAATALALYSGRRPQGELRWLAYPVLVLAGLKFLVEDLPLGNPMMLFLAFMCLGAAFILVPHLRKPQES